MNYALKWLVGVLRAFLTDVVHGDRDSSLIMAKGNGLSGSLPFKNQFLVGTFGLASAILTEIVVPIVDRDDCLP